MEAGILNPLGWAGYELQNQCGNGYNFQLG